MLVYRIDSTTGRLKLVPGSPFASGPMPIAVAFAGGRFAYVVNKDSNNVSGYAIDAATGRLRRVPGSPFEVSYSSNGPADIMVDGSGKFAYVVSDAGVSAFAIDATSGRLASIAGSPFGTNGGDGFGTASIALDSSGRHAYVLNTYRNRLASYVIDSDGSLKLAGRQLSARQNSNDVGAYSRVVMDPAGRFAYETSSCCVNVYAVDAATGSLTSSSHLSLGEPGAFLLRGFAIDPSGRFAYGLDLNRLYAYRIDAATGKLKGLGQAVTVGDARDALALDLRGAFAYVFDSGSRTGAPRFYAYRINAETGKLTPLPHAPFAVAAGMTDSIAAWFNAGECASFRTAASSGAQAAPLAKRPESLVLPQVTSPYSYDPTSRTALHYPRGDSGVTITARNAVAPPPGVARTDLRTLRTTSGIRLGSSATTVIRALGNPKIINGCGQQRYVYTTDAEQSLVIQFTITQGRVTEISEDLGG